MLKVVIGGLSFLRLNFFFCRTLNSIVILFDKEMGWKVETDEAEHICGLIDENGDKWRPNDAVTWVDFQEQFETTRLKSLWQKASQHRGGANLEEGADLTVAQRHYKRLIHAGKHGEAGALMTICTGACWSPARLIEEDIIPRRRSAPYVENKGQMKATYFGNVPRCWIIPTLQFKNRIDFVQSISATKMTQKT